jgi:hypothetical protein
MGKERLGKLQIWVLITLLSQGRLKRREIYVDFYRIAADPDRDANRARKIKQVSGIVTKSLRRLIDKGYIRCYLDYPGEETISALPGDTRITLTEAGKNKACELTLVRLRAGEIK